MDVAIIVQARMGSTRLPGKIMKKVMGKPLLEYLLERLQRVKKADEICIATTVKSQEQPILDVCSRMLVKTFRGAEEDVLERYFLAAQELNADTVVRVTSDCPLIDPEEIDKLIEYYTQNAHQYALVSDCRERSYPWGMSAEIFSFAALRQAHQEAKLQPEREHVTPYIRTHSELFRIGEFAYKENQRDHRWTLDTIEDFQLISKILENLYPRNPHFSIEDALDLLKANPEWQKINSHINQKVIGV